MVFCGQKFTTTLEDKLSSSTWSHSTGECRAEKKRCLPQYDVAFTVVLTQMYLCLHQSSSSCTLYCGGGRLLLRNTFQLHLSEHHSRITTWKKTGRRNRERVGIAISSSYIRIWDKTLFLYCSNGQLPAPKPNLGPPNHPIRPAIGVRNKYQTIKSRENSLISVSGPLTD